VRRLVLAALVAASVAACSLFTPANVAILTADGEALASCIISQAVSGQTSAAQIALKCGAPAGFDVLAFVAQLLGSLTAAPDAGTAGGPSSPAKSALVDALKAIH
jgi:hypothetical protein